MASFYRSFLQFCSRFELQHRSFGELNIATQVMRVENGLDVLQRVAPVTAAICGTVAPAIANRTTAVPRRS